MSKTRKTDKIIIDCENTVIISDDGIKVRSEASHNIYEQTYRYASEEKMPEADEILQGISDLEKELYREAINREKDNKYKFQRKLVSGGMGAILNVIDQDLQRSAAMKIVLPSHKNDRDALNELIKEAKITGMLEHPNIVPVHELGLSNEAGLYFTMKMVEGKPLHYIITEIKKGTPHFVEEFSIYELLNIFRRICDAIAFANSKDIIHQDIKPHNVIVGQFGEVMVMDWGLARYIGNPEKEKDAVLRGILRDFSVVSKEGRKIIQGSPAYMSPEQVKGDGGVLDKQTDIFLLGTTLYHMLTLEPPYEGENIQDVLNKAGKRDLIPPQIRNPERLIPEELCRIITKATAFEKEDRYYSVQEIIADLDDVISGKWSKQEKLYFSNGDFLMKEGEAGEEAYLIIKGSVQVFKESGGSKVLLSTLHEGDIVGEMALITNDKRSASVKAVEDTIVAVLTKQHLARNLKKLPAYIEKIVSTITRRLQVADTFIHPHLTVECTPFVLQQLYLILKSEAGDRKRYMVSVDKIAARIADNLGVPVAKVEKVFVNAAEANLFSIQQNRILIDDINKITRAARWAKLLIEE